MRPTFFLLGSRWELFLKLKNPIATLNAMHELLKMLQNDHFLWHGGQLNIYKATQFHQESHKSPRSLPRYSISDGKFEVKSGACCSWGSAAFAAQRGGCAHPLHSRQLELEPRGRPPPRRWR